MLKSTRFEAKMNSEKKNTLYTFKIRNTKDVNMRSNITKHHFSVIVKPDGKPYVKRSVQCTQYWQALAVVSVFAHCRQSDQIEAFRSAWMILRYPIRKQAQLQSYLIIAPMKAAERISTHSIVRIFDSIPVKLPTLPLTKTLC